MNIFLFLLIAFTSAQNISDRNFISDCGRVFTEKQFVIESTAYPSNYPASYQCSYLIKSTCPTHFHLHLLDFNLEQSLGCAKDRLEVADKDALCGNLNGVKTYFAKTGALILRFVSDAERTGRGYRILVTRTDQCEEDATTSSAATVPKWYTTSKDVEYTTTTMAPRPQIGDKCCQNTFNEKHFTLTSPNYPQSMSTAIDCSYEIRKSANNICRLRLHFHLFYFGGGANCQNGFLQIDNKYFCGCKSELKIISPFNSADRKLIRFVSKGYEQRSYTGFVVEVIQDECAKRLVPKSDDDEPWASSDNATTSKHHRLVNDEINKVDGSRRDGLIEKLHLIKEKTEILPIQSDNFSINNEQTIRKFDTQIIKHVYVFAEEPEREETNYVDTSAMGNQVFQDTYGFSYCLDWNRKQFLNVQSKQSSCNIQQHQQDHNYNPAEKRCVDLEHVRGYFKSPGYPLYYPGNVNICYRFKPLPGYCEIRMHIRDFNVQQSDSCQTDYFLLDNKRYCGNYLSNRLMRLDMRDHHAEGNKEMNFVTDPFYCGRGFFATYEQIACHGDMPTLPPLTTAPPRPFPCSKTFQDEVFTIALPSADQEQCTFAIKKYSPDVCRVRLYFEQFDLFCASEALLIDGMMYCGHLSGKSVTIDVSRQDPALLIYKRRSNQQQQQSRLLIQGLQINDECIDPEVPPERLLDPRTINHDRYNLTYYLKIVKHKEVCGLITNTTQVDLPKTFCEFIRSNVLNSTISECVPMLMSDENSIFVPSLSDPQRIELKIDTSVDTIDEIEFSEIECQDLP